MKRLKWSLYISSLGFLFVLIGISKFKLIDIAPGDGFFVNVCKFICSNIFISISALIFIFTAFLARDISRRFSGSKNFSERYYSIQNESHEYAAFIMSYIFPLIGFNLDDPRDITAFIVLLIMIGYIFVNSNLYYKNPVLLLVGYRIYKAKCLKDGIEDEVILITKSNIKNEQKLRTIMLESKVYLASVKR